MKHNAKFYPMSDELAQFSKQIFSNVNWRWIKGHQKNISIPIYLNNIADCHAQKFRKKNTVIPKWPRMTSNKGLIKYQDLPIMCLPNIMWAQETDQLLMYYSEKWNIPQSRLYIIDWYAFTRAIKKFLQVKLSK